MTKPTQEGWDVDINMFTIRTRLCPPAEAPESCHMDPGGLNTDPPFSVRAKRIRSAHWDM